MDRIYKIIGNYGNEEKYVLVTEYNGFGIYQRVCPNGFRVSQEWLITNGHRVIVCQSYNNVIKEELMDAIDKYQKSGRFGFRVIKKADDTYIVHPCGKAQI